MKFSERIGAKPVKSIIQLNSMDKDLKNGLWNVFLNRYVDPLYAEIWDSITYSNSGPFLKSIWDGHLKLPLDTMPTNKYEVITKIRSYCYDGKWDEFYDFIEFIVKNPHPVDQNKLANEINLVLKRELSGYRFIGNELVPLSDETQINEIQKSLDITNNKGLEGVRIHLISALEKLSDKKSPDYRNSIKESISAIESIAQIISGVSKAELGKTLKLLKEKINLHGALEQGFIKIYGYTSDSDGIRHSLMEESDLDLEDALYMLTSCSAFINYLMVKANKAGVKLN